MRVALAPAPPSARFHTVVSLNSKAFRKLALIRRLFAIFSRSSTREKNTSARKYNSFIGISVPVSSQTFIGPPTAADLVLQAVHNYDGTSLKTGIATHKNAHNFIEIKKENPKHIEIRMIYVDNSDRKKCVGTKLLKKVTSAADDYGVTLSLKAVPMKNAPGEITRCQLIAWYRSHGFKLKTNPHTNNEMERLPK